ncbi:MAG: NAD+---dinitrogen-reductase ADP-D-ribosyltransferase [Deferribacteres bacterium]|jgi:NAD+--dinitrogen-reductase ADP-D-ribosyltransferase|nr:NAD(+)--dinitrogen-reductase ADP-D-ribosyltransferase [Deferribacteraceae bacterium]MDK2792228.1 NAD+---dinitrogen-reductase ADP-D-ribosyltransferase [Deferribacteres bacterium]
MIKQIYCHKINKANLPPYLLIDEGYNNAGDDLSLLIDGVIEYHPDLFERITGCGDPVEASEIFLNYMNELFHLKEKVNGKYVNSYLKVLRGWLFDSNSKEGAVIKGWVESRFGIIPNFHKQKINSANDEAYYNYLMERMGSSSSKNLIEHQFDLLYTYNQYAIKTFFKNSKKLIKVYKGVNSLEEFFIKSEEKDRKIMMLNNVTSFTTDREIACTFGDYIIETEVHYTKIIFIPELFPLIKFFGESEIIAIGGFYNTRVCYI